MSDPGKPGKRYNQKIKKVAGLLHRTATTAYPCCLPTLGEFSRSWSCKTCRRKDKEAG